jgi:acyl carrier protein
MTSLHPEIRKFIVDNFLFGRDAGALKDHDSFLDGGIIDSTGVLELVGFIEEHFDVKVSDGELLPDNLDSIDKVSNFVQRKLEASREKALHV